jgi:DNA-directed RNA polymerase sigma subunit (sigma70/sigma32)
VHFAKQYKNYINQNEAFDIDDLISEGNIGLIKSIPKFKLRIFFTTKPNHNQTRI